MKPKILLRIAAIVIFIHDIGHTMGHFTSGQTSDPSKQEVLKMMADRKFPFMGAVHSMEDYYTGYSFACTLALLLIAAILWFASDEQALRTPLARKSLIMTTIILILWGVDELIFFFPFAAAFSFLTAILTLVAIVKLPRPEQS